MPTPTQIGRMRTFFIGGSAELKDLSLAGMPPPPQSSKAPSRYGFATESSGWVNIRVNTLVQVHRLRVLARGRCASPLI